MKKTAGVLLFLVLFSISFVSAGPVYGVQQLLDGLRDIVYLLIQFFFDISGDLGIYDEYIFAKIILLVIIFIVVYTVLKESIFKSYVDTHGKGKPVLYIIAAAISILAIRYLPNEMIEAILLPYSALGVGLTVFLPLIIYFFFLHQSGMGIYGRRAGWVVFGASFIALWWSRRTFLQEANFIYWIGVAFIVLCLLFDNRIHGYFGLYHIKKFEKMTKEKQNRYWKRELMQLEEDYRNGILGEDGKADAKYNREKRILDRRILDTSNTD
ncbi:MAG: hypothetical protein WC548_02260 [Candidatus Pacearchaeota archaeon]